jgi:hypothetical protein
MFYGHNLHFVWDKFIQLTFKADGRGASSVAYPVNSLVDADCDPILSYIKFVPHSKPFTTQLVLNLTLALN